MLHSDLRQHSSLAAIAAAATAAENHHNHHHHHHSQTTNTTTSSANSLPQSSFPQKTPFAIQELLGLTNDQNESNDLKNIANNHIEACTGNENLNFLG